MAVRNVLAGIRSLPRHPAAPGGRFATMGRFRGAKRSADLDRQLWRAMWDAHVELACRLPLAAPDEFATYDDAYLLDDTEAVVQAVATLIPVGPTPAVRVAAEQTWTALRPLHPLRPARPGARTGEGDARFETWGHRSAFVDALRAALPHLQALNDHLRAYVGADVILPKGAWHRPANG
jgi:hypothetical protein